MPKINTVVTFSPKAIVDVLKTQADNNLASTFASIFAEQKFAGAMITVPVEETDGISIKKTVALDKKEFDDLFINAARGRTKAEGAISSVISYVFADKIIEEISVTLNTLTR